VREKELEGDSEGEELEEGIIDLRDPSFLEDRGYEDPIECLNCRTEIPEENRDFEACTETCPKCGQVQRAIP